MTLSRSIAAAALALVPGTACMTAAPPARFDGELVTVRAATPERAAELGARVDRSAAWIRSVCPATRSARPQLWEVERIEPFAGFRFAEETDGLHFDFLWIDRIYLADYAEEGAATHELGHFLLGDEWRALPPFVEEGLANWFHVHDPNVADSGRRELLWATAAIALGVELGLELTPTTSPDLPPIKGERGTLTFTSDLPGPEKIEGRTSSALVFRPLAERLAAHAHGYVLVERIAARGGLKGLLALCERATEAREPRVPLEWLYEAAGVDGRETLRVALLEELEPRALRLVLEHLSVSVLDFLAQEHGMERTSAEFARWVRETDPRLAFPGAERPERLLSVDGIDAYLAVEGV